MMKLINSIKTPIFSGNIFNDLLAYIQTQKSTYFFVFLLFLFILPISLGYYQGQVYFHTTYYSAWRAVPIGMFIVAVLLILSLFKNIRANYLLFFIVIFSTVISYVFSHDIRTLIIGGETVLLISTVAALDWTFARSKIDWVKCQKYLFFIILFIVFVKFCTDIHYYYAYYIRVREHVTIPDGGSYVITTSGLYQNPFSNSLFIHKRIFIYDYFAYFQLIYILGFFLSLRMFKIYPLLSTILIIFISVYMYYSTSRLWVAVFLSMPGFYIIARMNWNFKQIFLLFLAGFIFIVGMSGYFYKSIDLGWSLNFRMRTISEFFSSMSWQTFFFPQYSPSVSSTKASMHNEFLEVWYRCGIAAALIFWWWGYKKLKEVYEKDRLLSVLLLFILIFGGVIQLNYLHLYTMLLLSIFISVSRVEVIK